MTVTFAADAGILKQKNTHEINHRYFLEDYILSIIDILFVITFLYILKINDYLISSLIEINISLI